MKKDDIMEIIKEVLAFIFVTAGVFAWIMLMLLIISFVGMSIVSMNIEHMAIAAGAGAVIFDVFYVRGRINKRKKRSGT